MPSVFFLLLACFQQGAQDPAKMLLKKNKVIAAWWTRPDFCAELGIDDSLRILLAEKLNQMQTTYQVTRTKIGAARKQQSEMLLDYLRSDNEVATFHAAEVAHLSAKMSQLNFEARLSARRQLNKTQLALIAEKCPRFFSSPWFRRSRVQVREGKVTVKKK